MIIYAGGGGAMGSRDVRHKEAKKPKKDSVKKASPIVNPVTASPSSVQVVKRGKKEKTEE